MNGRLRRRIGASLTLPLIRRVGYHLRRLTAGLERGFLLRLAFGLASVVLLAAALITAIEGPRSSAGAIVSKLAESFHWGVTAVMGSGDASYVTSPAGYIVSWLLVLFGVAIVAAITGALVGFVIDFLLKEGQGMGAAGYRDGISHVNPPTHFRLTEGDDAVVVAESLRTLAPLKLDNEGE